ncbi:MAG TPA: DUF1080 domain-containing protein, partial [Gemmatales bacterium]|nr:DUF1080 domain-containing protein [Gemmatales bacterium]
PDPSWQKRHATILERALEQPASVVLIGGSITQGWEGAGKNAWNEHFAGMRILNAGISGDRTEHVLWRLGEGGVLAAVQPAVAMIMIGTNNTGSNTADEIAQGIEAIVELIHSKHPQTKILLLGVFPRAEVPEHPARRKIEDISKIISKLHDGKKVIYLDIGNRFLNEEGKLTKDIMSDFLHLTGKGYSIWAEAVKPVLVQLGAPVDQAVSRYVPLFNGKDLTGWYGWNIHAKGGSPAEVAKLSPEERAKKIAEWTADAEKHWSVQNGELVNDGHGAYLATEKNYRDYELLIDYKTVPLADSGIYLKATPQVQIWDSTEEKKFNIGADKGSGGLWNNSPGAKGKDPLVRADKPFGEWNRFRIRQIGERTWVWLNDQLVVDDAVMENFWDRKKRLAPEGPIILQTHGGEIRWRNIQIREFTPEEAHAELRKLSRDGFTSLFNGKDFEGWAGSLDNYEIVDGAIRCKPGKGGTIFTRQEYGDFIVRLEFKLPPSGNNGLAIRYPGEGDTAYVGMCEIQVLDDTSPKYQKLDPRQYNGSAYGMAASHRGYLRPAGEWNYEEITVKGSTIKVELNGTTILETDLSKVTEYMANSPHPGKSRTTGHFGFAGHNDPVMFRNIEIRELK